MIARVEGAFRDPGIPDGEETAYRGLIGGREAGEGSHRIEHADGGDGRPRYRQRLEMRVLGELHYELDATFLRNRGTLQAEGYRLDTRHGGELVAREEGRFRGVKGLGFGGEVAPYPRDLAPLLGCAVSLRGLDFEPGERRGFALWLANTVHWEIEARVERCERVEVPAGSFDAWRVQVWPSFRQVAGRLDALVRMVLPPFHLHFAAEAPHRLLRFSFPTGPFRWNARGLIEATDLTRG